MTVREAIVAILLGAVAMAVAFGAFLALISVIQHILPMVPVKSVFMLLLSLLTIIAVCWLAGLLIIESWETRKRS